MAGQTTVDGWVLQLSRDRPDLTQSELHVLRTLAARHNRDFGAAWPKIDRLAQETHISRRQIIRILDALADSRRPGGQLLHISYGPLPTAGRNGRSAYGNVYRFFGFDEIPEGVQPRRRDVVDTRPKSSATVSLGSSDICDIDQVTSATRGQVTSVNSPLRTPIGNSKGNTEAPPVFQAEMTPRYDQVVDLIAAAAPALIIHGRVDRNRAAVNESTAPLELIAEAYVALHDGRWDDNFVRRRGSLEAVVENLGGYRAPGLATYAADELRDAVHDPPVQPDWGRRLAAAVRPKELIPS